MVYCTTLLALANLAESMSNKAYGIAQFCDDPQKCEVQDCDDLKTSRACHTKNVSTMSILTVNVSQRLLHDI